MVRERAERRQVEGERALKGDGWDEKELKGDIGGRREKWPESEEDQRKREYLRTSVIRARYFDIASSAAECGHANAYIAYDKVCCVIILKLT